MGRLYFFNFDDWSTDFKITDFMNQKIELFENKVLKGLNGCLKRSGVEALREDKAMRDAEVSYKNEAMREKLSLAAAVSGGADSVALLYSLSTICKRFGLQLNVITVNHNIRTPEETCGDAYFVQALCKKLSDDDAKINCERIEIERDSILKYSQENKTGIEEAARIFRYKAFERFIAENNIDFLCLAHNKNDQLETALMRFLQANDADFSPAIPYVRGKYIRPLLDISREEIEEYLTLLGAEWRTDSSNFDTKYLRNKIRQKLVPFLNDNFEGWQNAVLSGIEKSEVNRELIADLVDKVSFTQENCEGKVSFSRKDFDLAPSAIKHKLLLKGLNLAGVAERVPHSFLSEVLESLTVPVSASAKITKKRFANVEISFKKDKVLFEKVKKNNTDLVFFDIIEETGVFEFPFGTLEIFMVENKSDGTDVGKCKLRINGSVVEHCFSLPVCIQNAQLDDCIKTSDGSMRKINDIYSDWHVPVEVRPQIPVLLELKEREFVITCVLGKMLGFKDWIVYEKN